MSSIHLLSQQLLKHSRQGGGLYIAGQLRVLVEVTDLAPIKTVGIRYTDDGWLTWKDTDGAWSRHDEWRGTDEFLVLTEPDLKPAVRVHYAIYYRVNGLTFWENNHSSNYSVQF